ncbi:MAG: hypothetical protein H0W53_09655 [Acidobacteria bacterium]|nr:hypothetical protein [Acidobacteriota bacterium]
MAAGLISARGCAAGMPIAALCMLGPLAHSTDAHPLGNFSVNQFVRIDVAAEYIGLHFVVDMAEIAAFQELRKADPTYTGDQPPSLSRLHAYLESLATEFAGGLAVTIDGTRLPIALTSSRVTTPPGSSGLLPTLRIECDYRAVVPSARGDTPRQLRLGNTNYRDRAGWREIVVTQMSSVVVFDSSALGDGVTDELKTYPEDRLMAPLDERVAELSFTRGEAPAGATALLTRQGRPIARSGGGPTAGMGATAFTVALLLLGVFVAVAVSIVRRMGSGRDAPTKPS